MTSRLTIFAVAITVVVLAAVSAQAASTKYQSSVVPVIADMAGTEVAEAIALVTEYEWHRDPSWDPFAAKHGLVGG